MKFDSVIGNIESPEIIIGRLSTLYSSIEIVSKINGIVDVAVGVFVLLGVFVLVFDGVCDRVTVIDVVEERDGVLDVVGVSVLEKERVGEFDEQGLQGLQSSQGLHVAHHPGRGQLNKFDVFEGTAGGSPVFVAGAIAGRVPQC